MKIAILGSAPSSLRLAPFGDPSWKIWGCSPGVYSQCPRVNAWFELHRWEPGVIGVAASQKQWFSPEYVAWMALRGSQGCAVWMYEPVPEIQGSRRLPIEDLQQKYGTFFFTSSIAWMIACAIEEVLEERAARTVPPPEPDQIALFGIDMAASEEYGYQRAGCQHFLLLAADLGIKIVVPPESDLLRPMPLYGICESSHYWIKMTERKREIQARINAAQANIQAITNELHFCRGVMEDIDYQMQTWGDDRVGMGVAIEIRAKDPEVQQAILDSLPPPPVAAPAGYAGANEAVATGAGAGSTPGSLNMLMGNGQPYTGRVNLEAKPAAKRKKPAQRPRKR